MGDFVFVHLHNPSFGPRGKSRWLLIKRRDEHGNASWRIADPAMDHSVLTGRTMKEVQKAQLAKRAAR